MACFNVQKMEVCEHHQQLHKNTHVAEVEVRTFTVLRVLKFEVVVVVANIKKRKCVHNKYVKLSEKLYLI